MEVPSAGSNFVGELTIIEVAFCSKSVGDKGERVFSFIKVLFGEGVSSRCSNMFGDGEGAGD